LFGWLVDFLLVRGGGHVILIIVYSSTEGLDGSVQPVDRDSNFTVRRAWMCVYNY